MKQMFNRKMKFIAKMIAELEKQFGPSETLNEYREEIEDGFVDDYYAMKTIEEWVFDFTHYK